MTQLQTPPPRLVVGITGATGIVYAVRALQVLRELSVETHLVVSRAGDMTRAYETTLSAGDLAAMADHVHHTNDFGASIASGSFTTLGMLIAPASMRTVAEVATGVSSTLLTRAADVTLKERRRLVLLAREAPLSLVHLRNMTAATEAGAIIFPPVPAFYTAPHTLEDLVDHTVGRALDLFGLRTDIFPRWTDGLRRQILRGEGSKPPLLEGD